MKPINATEQVIIEKENQLWDVQKQVFDLFSYNRWPKDTLEWYKINELSKTVIQISKEIELLKALIVTFEINESS